MQILQLAPSVNQRSERGFESPVRQMRVKSLVILENSGEKSSHQDAVYGETESGPFVVLVGCFASMLCAQRSNMVQSLVFPQLRDCFTVDHL